MTFMQRILASWWKRIITYVALNLLIFICIFAITYCLDKLFNLESPVFLIAAFTPFISLFFSSAVIEGLRKGHRLTAFGIHFTRKSINDLLLSATLIIIPFTLLIISLKLLKINIITSDIFYYKLFMDALFFLFGVVITEELIFRGIIFQAILDRFGIFPALLISSLAFSIGHYINPDFNGIAFVNTFIAGILLGVMYIQTKSLYLPIFWHFFWNYFQATLLGSKVSGYKLGYTVIYSDWISLPHWLFGGDYGLEGGMICTLILLLTFPLILKFAKPSPYVSAMIFKRNILESGII